MTMDFSSPPPAGTGMIGPVEQALRASHDQLITVFREHGVTLSPLQMWQHMGATVMNGENDIGGERFTVADARGLAAFAGRAGLARVSMWSINRDSQCGSVFSVTGVLSNTCSGTPQSDLEFSRIFAEMAGVVPRAVAMSAAALLPPQPDTNPADAPYPIWSPAAPYPQGYKVVESGNIYQALYYTSGADPSAQAQTGARGPWQLVGPVLPGDHAPALPRLPAGTYPAWSVSAVYQSGRPDPVRRPAVRGQVEQPGRLAGRGGERLVRQPLAAALCDPGRARPAWPHTWSVPPRGPYVETCCQAPRSCRSRAEAVVHPEGARAPAGAPVAGARRDSCPWLVGSEPPKPDAGRRVDWATLATARSLTRRTSRPRSQLPLLPRRWSRRDASAQSGSRGGQRSPEQRGRTGQGRADA